MSSNAINPDKLQFDKLTENDRLSQLDCTEKDGSDPLEIQKFVQGNAARFQKANLSAVYVVRYEDEIVGCFSLSMFAINVERLAITEKVKEAAFKSYPAMLLGQMCTNKKDRGRNIGSYVCKFAVGLAQELSSKVACRYVMLHTNKERVSFYERNEFILAENQPIDGKILMYRRISDIKSPTM